MDQNNSESYVPYFLLRNKLLKFFALNILKNLPETLLSEEPNLSTIITGGIPISEYRLCPDCNGEILSSNSPRSISILVCGHVYHRTCVEKKRIENGKIICSDCSESDDLDPIAIPSSSQEEEEENKSHKRQCKKEEAKKERQYYKLENLIQELSADVQDIEVREDDDDN